MDTSQESPLELSTSETPPTAMVNDALVDIPTTERTCSATESQHAEAMPRRRVQLGGKWAGRLRSRKTVEAAVP